MTLWNPKNVFSRPPAGEPAATFDPSRTGDPVTPGPGDPGIGYGETHVGGGSVTVGYRRHPIGFAPPGDPEPQTRYRTELSFKRHHELPRAGTTPPSGTGDGDGDGIQPSWQTPVSSTVGSDDAVTGSIEAAPQAKDTPFYKREISFRRKKEEVVAAPVTAEATEQVEDAEQIEVPETVAVVSAADVVEHPAVVAATTDGPTEHAASDATAEASVPFYKREISFRRKKTEETAVTSGTQVTS